MSQPILHTGQTHCYNTNGQEISCHGTGQDGEIQAGVPWPKRRFDLQKDTVHDQLTGLVWTRDANIGGFPCTWREAFEKIHELNRKGYGSYSDWRLPNRNELRSLMSYQTRKPALPENHPFTGVFLGWYWSSTTAAINPAYAWSVHLEGARMFYGRKDQYQLFWPVRGKSLILPATGQTKCYNERGQKIACTGSGQDGDLRHTNDCPHPRFKEVTGIIHDRLTGLGWYCGDDLNQAPVSWQESLDAVRAANRSRLDGITNWRLPNINELVSLVDCDCHSPALPVNHPFQDIRDGYWSSTTSFFETDWAWVLYMTKGACGVGYKPGKTFFILPVTTLNSF